MKLAYVREILVTTCLFASGLVHCTGAVYRPSAEDLEAAKRAVEILDSVKFRFTKRVSEVPEITLAQAGVIRIDERLDSVMTDVPERFNDTDIVFPGALPLLLNFCGTSDEYLVLSCLQGGGSRFVLIGGLNTSPKTVLFQAVLFCECRTVEEIKMALRRGEFQRVDAHSTL